MALDDVLRARYQEYSHEGLMTLWKTVHENRSLGVLNEIESEILRRMNLAHPEPVIAETDSSNEVPSILLADYEAELRSQQGGPDPDRSSDFQGF